MVFYKEHNKLVFEDSTVQGRTSYKKTIFDFVPLVKCKGEFTKEGNLKKVKIKHIGHEIIANENAILLSPHKDKQMIISVLKEQKAEWAISILGNLVCYYWDSIPLTLFTHKGDKMVEHIMDGEY